MVVSSAVVGSGLPPSPKLARKPSRVTFCHSAGDPSDLDEPESPAAFRLATLRHGAVADIGGKLSQEDVLFAVPDLEKFLCRPIAGPPVKAFFAVFDGHAGVHAAEFARENLLRHVTAHAAFPEDIGAAMREAFLRTDADFYQAVQAGDVPDAGTTACAVLVWGSKLYVANAGDSRAVICCDRKPVQLTRDHRPCEAKEAARIQLQGGFISDDARLNGQLSVSRALGNFSDGELKQQCGGGHAAAAAAGGFGGPLTAEPELFEYELSASDEFLVLACDGLWEMFPNERVVELARQSLKEVNDPAECAKDLVAEAKRNFAADNVSVILCCFSSEAPRKRTFALGRSWSCEALSKLQGALQDAAE